MASTYFIEAEDDTIEIDFFDLPTALRHAVAHVGVGTVIVELSETGEQTPWLVESTTDLVSIG